MKILLQTAYQEGTQTEPEKDTMEENTQSHCYTFYKSGQYG